MEGKSFYDITLEIVQMLPEKKINVGSMCTCMMYFQQVFLKAENVEQEITSLINYLTEREEALAKRG